MMVYGNRTTKLPVYLGKNASLKFFTFYVVGTNREGRNLYPYTRLLPRWADFSDFIGYFGVHFFGSGYEFLGAGIHITGCDMKLYR